MKTISILSLKLENFKCHKALTMAFGGESRTIYGDNAAGKTSVYDGLTWLLFGKTSSGSADNELLKPLGADGQVLDHAAVTSVEAILHISEDGSERNVLLRRELQEVWTSRRGSSEQVYDRNTCAYYIDGVPVKKNEYDRRISELVAEDAFRLLTSVYYFAEMMPWKDRRAVLADLCGNVSDSELMAEDARFADLLQKTGAVSLEDYRKVLLARKKGMTVDRNAIPARISEQKAVIASLAGTDFDALQAEYDLQEATVRDLEAKLNSIRNTAQTEKLKARMDVLAASLAALEAENKAYRAAQERAKPNLCEIQMEIDDLADKRRRAEHSLQSNAVLLARTDDTLERLRGEWETVNGSAFDGECCATCGQRLPQDAVKTAKKRFKENKERELKRIEATASAAKESRAAIEAAIKDAQAAVSGYAKKIEALQADLERQKQAAAAVVITDMADYAERKNAIEAEGKSVRDELSSLLAKSDTAAKTVELQLTDARLKAKHLSEQLGCRGSIDFAEKRIAELREQQKEAAKQLEEIDRELFLIEDFVRFKAKRVEERVNDCFRLATFRLFRELVKGGLEECCDAVHDGVPYQALNNGMRINIGLDIIRTLSEHYGVKVPLFIDNAESVTALEDAGTQMIRLVVSEQDKILRIE